MHERQWVHHPSKSILFMNLFFFCLSGKKIKDLCHTALVAVEGEVGIITLCITFLSYLKLVFLLSLHFFASLIVNILDCAGMWRSLKRVYLERRLRASKLPYGSRCLT